MILLNFKIYFKIFQTIKVKIIIYLIINYILRILCKFKIIKLNEIVQIC